MARIYNFHSISFVNSVIYHCSSFWLSILIVISRNLSRSVYKTPANSLNVNVTQVIFTIGILKGWSIRDTTIDWAEPDSPMIASSGEAPWHMGDSASASPFIIARAARWPVSGYAHESKIL